MKARTRKDRRCRVELRDRYIKNLLYLQSGGRIARKDFPPEAIEAKRLSIIAKRAIWGRS